MIATRATSTPETSRPIARLNLLRITLPTLLVLSLAHGFARAADIVVPAPAQSHASAIPASEPLTSEDLRSSLQSAIAQQCPDSDAQAIASAIASNVALALGEGPYPAQRDVVERAAEDFLRQRECAFGDASLRVAEDLAWLMVLIIQDPATPEDQKALRDQLQSLVDEWITTFSKEQAVIIERDEKEISDHLTEVSKAEFTKNVDHYLSSPMYPMLNLPLNEYEQKKIRSYLNQKDFFLEMMQSPNSGAMRKRPWSLYRSLFGPDRTRIIWIEGQFPHVLEEKIATLVYKIAVLRGKKLLFVDGFFLESEKFTFGHYGPPFPQDPAEAREIASQLKSWYQATPETQR